MLKHLGNWATSHAYAGRTDRQCVQGSRGGQGSWGTRANMRGPPLPRSHHVRSCPTPRKGQSLQQCSTGHLTQPPPPTPPLPLTPHTRKLSLRELRNWSLRPLRVAFAAMVPSNRFQKHICVQWGFGAILNEREKTIFH